MNGKLFGGTIDFLGPQAMVLAAGFVQFLFLPLLGDKSFLILYPALFLACLWGGFWAGILATTISSATALYFFMEPAHSLAATDPRDLIALFVFFCSGCLFAFFSSTLKRTRMKLKENDQQLEALANTMPQLVWMVSNDGYNYWYNDRWYDFTGTTPEQMKGWGWKSVHDPKMLPAILEKWQRCLAEGREFEMEFPLKSRHGTYRWFLTRIVPYRDSQGNILRWFGTNTDIDEIKMTKDHLAQALKSREEFLSIASHELKTPLSSLKLQLQMIEISKADQNSELAAAINLCLRQVNTLADLVDTLLDITRIRAGKLLLAYERFNLGEMIQEVLSDLNGELKRARLDVRTEIDHELIVHWDRSRIAQVVRNLVSNAVKYAPGSELTIKALNAGTGVKIIVADSGPGIEKKNQLKIFDRFDRASRSNRIGGLGLGLYIVKNIVENHGGRIDLESDLGCGAEFRINLPFDCRERDVTVNQEIS